VNWRAAFFVLLAGVSAEAATLTRDVVYGEAGGETLKLDICTPDGPGPFPVVVLVHGGGWGSGDKAGAERPNSGADITPWFQPLTDAGIAWVSINYRLAPAHRWPAPLEDTRSALAWVRGNIGKHGGDPTRLAIMGHSAGGHLALMAALPAPGEPAPVSAAVGCAAVSDLVSDSQRRGEVSKALQALHNLPPEITPAAIKVLAASSPLGRVGPGCPPVLLLHGDADRTVPLAQSNAFQDKVRSSGGRCDLDVLYGAPHRLTEWAKHKPDWSRVLTDWLHARWAENAPSPKP
jgi:alpha-L-fucosidase 2